MKRFKAWLGVDQRRPVLLAVLALLGLCALALFNHLGSLGLMDKTEGLFVEVPRQMLESGDWVTPRWNGETFFDYPVWGYWMVGLSFRLFGISEWAARLPGALAATATVLAAFALVLHLAPPTEATQQRLGRATLAGSVLALSPAWVGWGRSSVTDMFLASAITWALFGFVLAYQAVDHPGLRRWGHAGMALFAGIAVLAKGPLGLLLPGLVIGVFLLLKGQLWSELRRTPLLPMAALFLGVAAPWYVLATKANGMEFLGHFLGFSNLERFTSVLYSHPGPPWFYLPWVLILLLPWSLFLPVAVVRLRFWRLDRWRQPLAPDDLSLFALVWLVVVVGFFSAAATKLPGYILPSVPAGALLVALVFQPLPSSAEAKPLGLGVRVTGWLNAGLLGLMALASALLPRLLDADPAYPGFADALSRSGLPWLLATSLLLAAIALVVVLLQPGGLRRLWLPNLVAFAAVLALVVPVLAPLLDRERLLPIRELARTAGAQALPDEPLVVVGYRRYSVVHYSGRPVLFVNNPTKVREPLSARPAGSTVLLFGSDRELLEFGLGPGDGLLLARRDAHRLVRLPIEQLRRLGEHP